MKFLTVYLLLFGFIQTFCESSSVNRVSGTPLTTPTPKVEKGNNMKEAKDNNALQSICQLTLDLPNLQAYLHPEVAGRNPLKIVKNSVLKDKVSLKKFDKDVEFIDKKEADEKNVPAIEFTKLEIGEKTATVEYKYAAEGIRGKVEFKFDGKWEVVSNTITES